MMTIWIVGAILAIWILISAILLVSLCIMSSRFNQSFSPSEEPLKQSKTESKTWALQEVRKQPLSKTSF